MYSISGNKIIISIQITTNIIGKINQNFTLASHNSSIGQRKNHLNRNTGSEELGEHIVKLWCKILSIWNFYYNCKKI